MAWREQMQLASFRGVAFSVLATDGQIGRRNVVHEYPLRDLPYAEDLGRKAREFSLDAFVLGDDYMSARDALVNALEAPGVGELVHPYRGRSQVVVIDARLSESTAEGGMARFSITFKESGAPLNPAPRTDTGAWVNEMADSAIVVNEGSFADLFTVAGFQDFVSTGALDLVTDSLNSIRLAANGLLSAAVMPEFIYQLTSIANSASSLILAPMNLAQGIDGLISGLFSLADQPARALDALRTQFNFGSSTPSVSTTTVTRQQQATNQSALINLHRRTAIITAARASSAMVSASAKARKSAINAADVLSYGEAIILRDEIAGQLETAAETAPDDVYNALSALRVAVIQDITAQSADLARTMQYPVLATQPMLIIAHRLYGAVDQADSLITRNHIRHPGFVPGGRSLEVLT